MDDWLAKGLAGGRVPQPRRVVEAPGQDGPASRAEGYRPYLTPVFHWLADGLTSGCVPQPRCAIITTRPPIVLPSGRNATAQTWPRCIIGLPTGCPEGTSRSCAVLSSHPVRANLPSYRMATDHTGLE